MRIGRTAEAERAHLQVGTLSQTLGTAKVL